MNCINYCNTVFQRVDDLPSLVDATRNHAYITPDNKIYILNADGTGYMQMSTDGGGVTVGLSSKDGSITIVETKDSVIHTFDISVSDDIINRITALENKQDKDTIYDDSVLETKINDILDRIANLGGTYTAGTGITISDDGVISLADTNDNDTQYTAGNGLTLTGTEFSIDDTQLATQEELNEVLRRLSLEESKGDSNTTYTLSKSGNVITLTGSDGETDTVVDEDTKYTAGAFVEITPDNVIRVEDMRVDTVTLNTDGDKFIIRLIDAQERAVEAKISKEQLSDFILGGSGSVSPNVRNVRLLFFPAHGLSLIGEYDNGGEFRTDIPTSKFGDMLTELGYPKFNVTHGSNYGNFSGVMNVEIRTDVPLTEYGFMSINISAYQKIIHVMLSPFNNGYMEHVQLADNTFLRVTYTEVNGNYSILLGFPRAEFTDVDVTSIVYKQTLTSNPTHNVDIMEFGV